MNRISVRQQLTASEKQIISKIGETCGILEQTAEILYRRGIDNAEKTRCFLHAGIANFADPFLLSGMDKFCARVKEAVEACETVVIYGDYDADGICASAILYRALKNAGIVPAVFIPEREEGYGLSIENIEFIAEKYAPDLIITVDCGISAAEEVEYIRDLGIDIIVTDHHELPQTLPNCIIINPKLEEQNYPGSDLCGAGVALKCAFALDSAYAETLTDFAAVATVADSVPLIGENRDIVCEGLELIKKGRASAAVTELLNGSKYELSAQTLAFSVAPKINAAGRMGSARSAVELFLSDDTFFIKEKAAELTRFNTERQEICEQLYQKVSQMAQDKYGGRIIMLSSPDFNAGFMGIAAAKLAEEYHKPVILFTENNGVLKGSARSICGVNIFSAIDSAKDLTVDFGGHAQAAGLSIKAADFTAFYQRVNGYLEKEYTLADYTPKITVEAFIDDKISAEFLRELKLLEPFGTGNPAPLFACELQSAAARIMKDGSPHILIDTPFLNMVYFGGAKHSGLISAPFNKTLVFEPSVSFFKGKEYLRGCVRHVRGGYSGSERERAEIFMNNIAALKNTGCDADKTGYTSQTNGASQTSGTSVHSVQEITTEQADLLLKERAGGYGTCFAIFEPANLSYYKNAALLRQELYRPLFKNRENAVIISPEFESLNYYSEIVYLDEPFGGFGTLKRKVFANSLLKSYNFIGKSDFSRQRLLTIYAYIKENQLKGISSADVYFNGAPPFGLEEFIAAAEIFIELGLAGFAGNLLYVHKGAKSDLGSSAIYNRLHSLKKAGI